MAGFPEFLNGPQMLRDAFGNWLGMLLWRLVLLAIVVGLITGVGLEAGQLRNAWVGPNLASNPQIPPLPAGTPADIMRKQAMEEERQLVDSILADPRYSAETKTAVLHQHELLPFKDEYRKLHGNVSIQQFKSPEAVAFLNKRLKETGKDWQITPENIDETFGNIMIDTSARGAYTSGVKIRGGGGNTFDQTDIEGAQTGVDLENTQKNRFTHTRIK
jgi:hypothetical protein